ncbi:MAG: hypothetical protein ACOYMF_14390 [Bacteroidales bacterium]
MKLGRNAEKVKVIEMKSIFNDFRLKDTSPPRCKMKKLNTSISGKRNAKKRIEVWNDKNSAEVHQIG